VAGVVEAVSDGVAGVAVGDEVVVNPAVSPVEAIVAHGIDSPLGAGFQILGEQRWGGHADRVVVPARNVLPRPAGAPGRSARPTRWRPSPPGGCCAAPG
jgi:NADPH:quinone reductase-like Zn-dependent oxidoreductase